jgi:hypothetical protein
MEGQDRRMIRARWFVFLWSFALLCPYSISAQELTLPQGTKITLELEDHLSTRLNREGDAFTARVVNPVYVGERQIIPKGSIVSGSISRILRPGRFRGKAVMNLLFRSIRVPGRPEIAIVASLSSVDPDGNSGVKAEGSVEGESSHGRDAGRVLAPAGTGAGIGGIVGGGQGAAVGAGIGAAVGLATVFATRGKDLEMRRGSKMEITLDRPLVVSPEGND